MRVNNASIHQGRHDERSAFVRSYLGLVREMDRRIRGKSSSLDVQLTRRVVRSNAQGLGLTTQKSSKSLLEVLRDHNSEASVTAD